MMYYIVFIVSIIYYPFPISIFTIIPAVILVTWPPQVMDLVEVALLLCTVGVGGVLLLLPLLYLCTSSSCTRGCCCPAINQLEEVEVRYTVVASEEAH